MYKQLQNIWTASYILKPHLNWGRWHRYLNLSFNWSLECAVTLELLIPVFGHFCCGFFWLLFGFFGWFVCLEVLLSKELFICTETGLLSITIYLHSFIVVLWVLWIVSGKKSVAVKWAGSVSVTVKCAGRWALLKQVEKEIKFRDVSRDVSRHLEMSPE